MLARIAAVRDQIRPSERKLADYAMAHPGDVINLSMAELADRVGVSEPTVARFCAALGCRGFREFKIKLAQDIAGGMPFLHQDLSAGGELNAEGGVPGAVLAGKLFDRTIATLMQVRNNLPADAVDRAADVLASARRIEFYGSGNSGTVAEDIQRKFFRLGMPTVAYTDSHVYFASALTLAKGDAVVAVSSTGRTRDILDAVRNARKAGADVVALTRSGSPLAEMATVSLVADIADDFDIHSPMTVRIAHLVLGDILSIAVALRMGDTLQERLKRHDRAVDAHVSETVSARAGDS
ncbi:transcriptional regulator [Azospirillum sp. TSH7]|jgi:RpiR family carbohydrate utilization transcriptional regulator|uniref:MurR/RpiR family transcriptional regulator n=1 Tax=unclassified Azospirillum TaxID=2630922 RepID=UPI000D609CFE|nr:MULTISPECIES: MurR/RpiR family transcriptional regulator [unclassified Azospirillum]PWC62093.1 transcriptional regulator [Azospirillum sp. TSH7]PWC68586.1 transcriptional regulator [Azospirillum sp. TSH20]QCG95300.1 MurR/RpiR family transcriptional regulator [Azospirillum sp. TSA2s]